MLCNGCEKIDALSKGWTHGENWNKWYCPKCSKKKSLFKDGEPCSHPGCLSHITHPCEGCGRKGGKNDN